MVESNRKSHSERIFQLSPLVILVSIVIIAISVFLISKSIGLIDKKYQLYQENLVELQKLDADFNQAVLRSRYELFTSYDPLVQNLQEQKLVQDRLVDLPQSFESETDSEFKITLEEIDNSITEKVVLSERFKSQNALLKNSLRYLPLLTDRLENKFNDRENNESITPTQLATLRSNLNQLIRSLLLYNVAVDQKLRLEIESLKPIVSADKAISSAFKSY